MNAAGFRRLLQQAGLLSPQQRSLLIESLRPALGLYQVCEAIATAGMAGSGAGAQVPGVAVLRRLVVDDGRRAQGGRVLVLAEAAAVEPGLEVAPGRGIPGCAQGGGAVVQVRDVSAMLPARQGKAGREQGGVESGHPAPFLRIDWEREGAIGRLRVGVHDYYSYWVV